MAERARFGDELALLEARARSTAVYRLSFLAPGARWKIIGDSRFQELSGGAWSSALQ